MRRDEATLLDICEAARSAISFVEGMEKSAFLTDRRTQKAVFYDIQTIGEAVKRLSKDFTAAHPEVPWPQIAGMRDKLVHDYDRVDVERVWGVLQQRLPELLEQIESLLPRP